MNKFPTALVPVHELDLEFISVENKKASVKLHLTFDNNAMMAAEEKLGVSMLTLNPEIWAKMTRRKITVLLWAAVQNYDEDYAGEEGFRIISNYITEENKGAVIEAVNEAYIAVQTEETRKRIREFAHKAGEQSPKENAPANQ